MKTYVKKPLEVRAAQWTGQDLKDAHEFIEDNDIGEIASYSIGSFWGEPGLILTYKMVPILVKEGDYVIESTEGRPVVIDKKVFEKKHIEKGALPSITEASCF